MNGLELSKKIAGYLDNKKAKDVKIIKIDDLTVVTDYIVIATGTSTTQVKALAGEVEYRIGLRGVEPYGVEGRDNGTWLVLDYSNVIVHIFGREAREFYNLDKLYED